MTALSDRLAEAKGDRGIDAIVAQAASHGHEIDRSTVARYVGGGGAKRPPDSILRALAAGLGLDVRDLRRLAGQPAGELGRWVPPDEAERLSRDQRRALDRLIKSMVSAEEVGDGDAGRDAAPIAVPPLRAAPELPAAARTNVGEPGNPDVNRAGEEAEGSQDPGGVEPS